MEDAFVVANLMKKHNIVSSSTPSEEQLKQVCQEYQDQRGKRVGDTVLRARKRAAITHALEGMEETSQWYSELAKEDGQHIMEGELVSCQPDLMRKPKVYLIVCACRNVQNNPRRSQRARCLHTLEAHHKRTTGPFTGTGSRRIIDKTRRWFCIHF
jgi:hypothetical protein